jgi:hypothetical protein
MMALVRGVMAASILVSSMFNVSGRISTNTGTPPRSTNALAVETNVKDGMMISSPGWVSASRPIISSAAVQECVSKARWQPIRCSSHALHFLVKAPFARQMACRMSLRDVPQLFAGHVRLVEGDRHGWLGSF